jgi:hypothetical protein
MTTLRIQLLLSIVPLIGAAACRGGTPLDGGIDPARVSEIAPLLPKGAFAFGPSITDRAAWEGLAARPAFKGVVRAAEKLVAEPVPEMTEEIYREYSRTGQRTAHYAKVRTARYERITAYVLAECVENKGRFIPPLKKLVASICDEPTWVYNFHDDKLQNWQGKAKFVDLGAVVPAQALAEAVFLLGDRLDDQTRDLIRANLRRRILEPYRAAVEGTGPGIWWITAEMNWNSVCTAGVVGAALGVCDDPAEKAWFVAAGEKYMHRYLAGFGPDGLCPEGMGYWGYGYGNFTVLAEEIWQASGGRVNLYDLPGAKLAALYPVRLEIINGVWPALADGPPNPTPAAFPLTFLNRRYSMGLSQWSVDEPAKRGNSLPETMLLFTPSSATTQPVAKNQAEFYELRSYFDHGGVLVCRPGKDAAGKVEGKLGVCIKGGLNAGPHYHQDVGTFIAVVGNKALILDPGGEVYTARTFSKDRFKSALLNSYGHPVPLVAGKMQRAGSDATAKVLKTDFTDAADTLSMDLRSAYAVPELKQLVRTFTYRRDGTTSLTVTDDFAFSSPQSFGNALITYGQWTREEGGPILISQDGQAASVTVDTGGVPFDVTAEPINEASEAKDHVKPTRIGINLKQPATTGHVTLTITPASKP